MITYNTIVGSKFFKDDEIIRVVKSKNSHLVIVRDVLSGEEKKIHMDDLANHYQRLKPAGIFSVFLVDVGHGKKDVICTLNRTMDIDKGEKTPFVACRQCIINTYANSLETRPGVENIGLCVSRLTTPPNMDFRVLLQNKGMNCNNVVSVYLNDTIDSILSFFNPLNYNEALAKIQKELDPQKIRNSASNLRELLDLNGFMSEFNNSFNILSLELKDEDEDPFVMMDDTFAQPLHVADVVLKVEKKIAHKIYDYKFIIADEYTHFEFINGYDFILLRKNNEDRKIFLMRFTKGDPIAIKPTDPLVDTDNIVKSMHK